MKRALRLVPFLAILLGMLAVAYPSRAGMGGKIQVSDSLRLNPTSLGAFKLADGAVHSAARYAFVMHGTGKPGTVDIRILDAAGHEVGKVGGVFKGQCPGVPTKTTFAKLNYSPASEVKILPQNGGQLVQVHCGHGSLVEFELPAAPASR